MEKFFTTVACPRRAAQKAQDGFVLAECRGTARRVPAPVYDLSRLSDRARAQPGIVLVAHTQGVNGAAVVLVQGKFRNGLDVF